MEATHDTHNSGGFWSFANVLLGLGFGGFALIAGASLVSQAVKFTGVTDKTYVDVPAPAAAAGSTTPAASKGDGSMATPQPATITAAASPVSTSGGVTTVDLRTNPANPMAYSSENFTVKAGSKVKLVFTNDSPVAALQHNLIISKPGAKDKVLEDAMKLLADPQAMAKGYIPDSQDILWHTKLLNKGDTDTVEFTAPAPGEYPFFCTFPGHALLMKGTMKVE